MLVIQLEETTYEITMGWNDCMRAVCFGQKIGDAEEESMSSKKIKELATIIEETKDATRKKQTIKMVVTLLMPIVCIMAMSLASLTAAIRTYTSSNTALHTVEFGMKIAHLINTVQKERGITTMFLSGDGANSQALESMSLAREDVDNAINLVGIFPPSFSIATHNNYFTKLENLTAFICDYRKEVETSLGTLESNIYFYTNLTQGMINSLTTYIVVPPGSDLWNRFVAFASIQRAGDALGIQRALGSSFYAACDISEERQNWFKVLLMIQYSSVEQTYRYFPEMKNSFNNKIARLWPLPGILSQKKENIIHNRNAFCKNATSTQKTANGLEWFTAFTKYIEIIELEAENVANQMMNGFQNNIAKAQMQLVIYSLAVVATSIICTVSAICIYHMTGKVQFYARYIADKANEVEGERKKTANLLMQMLPKKVACNLMNGREVDAEYHDGVTIYFSDIVGFTTISSTCSPRQVISLLNTLYSMFDATVEQYDVYKVETIGDAYMVVSGLHTSDTNIRHSYEIAAMALDLRKEAMKCKMPFTKNKCIHLRVGIHSGACAAGVVGKTMPRYCLFGDTVNTANRMESTGEAFKIHISHSTKENLDEIGGFVTERRATMQIKGKGKMETHWLVCKDSETTHKFNEETYDTEAIFARANKLIHQQRGSLNSQSLRDSQSLNSQLFSDYEKNLMKY